MLAVTRSEHKRRLVRDYQIRDKQRSLVSSGNYSTASSLQELDAQRARFTSHLSRGSCDG
uniref:Uncharacterized protein n=1 Tax=Zea mays TaxID=4577 RepID=C4IZV4_MAIZE|nr:unknown [Zea mays]